MSEETVGVDEDRGGRGGGVPWVPGLVNLGIGVPAVLPLYLVWWLLTKYLPMDCRSFAEAARPDTVNCNYTTLDHSGVVMFLAVVTGGLLLAVALVVNVVLPRRRGRRPAPWLGTAVLIPVPFAVLMWLA
ncbi:hypothetical protein ACIQNU_07770 [Streptomyces sp. NPDC091292]|uniref:hypothetical protein n=1 Tax=Streptomyces sp. NPDC091292 TaxID=3365991 RepID=UPI00380004BF